MFILYFGQSFDDKANFAFKLVLRLKIDMYTVHKLHKQRVIKAA